MSVLFRYSGIILPFCLVGLVFEFVQYNNQEKKLLSELSYKAILQP